MIFCLMQFESIHEELRRRIYSINKPQSILLDIDSTLFATFGKQEGNDYNQHYSNYGYHPLLVFDGLTGDLLKAELRSGNTYTSKGSCPYQEQFIKTLINIKNLDPKLE